MNSRCILKHTTLDICATIMKHIGLYRDNNTVNEIIPENEREESIKKYVWSKSKM
jgi:hypothetical protein